MKARSKITRRIVLSAAATVPLAALPSMGVAAQSSVMALFSQWRAIQSSALDVTDEQWDRECD